ncbi:hypothetical protein CgunFtcFv8_009017 [Champsocephalus gunnari]|uniref:Uncharacterized protein n=1 Tax=Champsocephalus gunnari TaxID=52237 RepID=A0AAN8HG94_CHAGU|nr:hypothetical protein CgunFtcFv8_009017 [Champsocephalus gunnari]
MQPIFHDVLHMLTPEELHIIEEIPAAEIKLDQLFQIAGVKWPARRFWTRSTATCLTRYKGGRNHTD